VYSFEELNKYLSQEEKLFLIIINDNGVCNFEIMMKNKLIDYFLNTYRNAMIATSKEIIKTDNYNLGFYKVTDEIGNYFMVNLKINYDNALKSKIMLYGKKLSADELFKLVNYDEIWEDDIVIVKKLSELPEVKIMKYINDNNLKEIKIDDLENIIDKNEIGFVIGKLKKDNRAIMKNKVLKIINNELYDYEKKINENNVKTINDLKRRHCIEINKKLVDVELSLTNRGIEFVNNHLKI